jgi:hypothetical protein
MFGKKFPSKFEDFSWKGFAALTPEILASRLL